MIYVRARNTAANLVLLEDTSKSPAAWIVMRGGQVCCVGSEHDATSQYSWLQWFPRIPENALTPDEAREVLQDRGSASLAARIEQGLVPQAKARPKADPQPDPEFVM